MKPNFLGIGAAKAGTTKVARLLNQHPEVFISSPKELHYFDSDDPLGKKTTEWYFSKFEENVARGEITPSYMFVPGAPKLIHSVLGVDMKFIVSLRNPVDRAYSHYCHAVNNWHEEKYRERNYPIEELNFRDAITQEPERLASGEFHIRHQSYFKKGVYSEQLERYFEFFPRENFYIYLFEDFIENPSSIMAEMCQFLGVNDSFKFRNFGEKVNAQTKGSLDLATRTWLSARYLPDNQKLNDLIGIDVSKWRV